MDLCFAFLELGTLATWGFYSTTYEPPFSVSTGIFLVGDFLLIFFFRLFYALSSLRQYITLTNFAALMLFNGTILTLGMALWVSKETYFIVENYDQLFIVYRYLILPWLGISIILNLYTFYIVVKTFRDLRKRRRVLNRIDYLLANPNEIQALEASLGMMGYSQTLRQNLLNREGLDQEEIQRLQRRILTEQNLRNSGNGQTDCVICTEHCAAGNKVIDLPCFHFFHELCVETWLRRSPTCPICRMSVRMYLAA